MKLRPELTAAEIAAFQPDAKVGLLATRDPAGLPHVTLITTLTAKDPRHLTWGQFCEGESKRNVAGDPRVGFLVLDLERRMWRGKARWTGSAHEGDDFVAYNQRPMFRYNSYFGIHTVHFMDLVGVTEPAALSVPRMLVGFALAGAGGLAAGAGDRVARHLGRGAGEPALKGWAERLLLRPDTLKFLAWIDQDGYPVIVPGVAAAPAGSHRLTLAAAAHAGELAGIGRGDPVAVFALNLKMESVLVRGRLAGALRAGPTGGGLLDIDRVYNSMPPQQGQVYPMPPLEPVREF